jgi:small-conductance mechanosensitive channel
VTDIPSRILGGWASLARRAGFFVSIVAGSAALALAIALPLWYAATRHSAAYSIAVIAFLAAGGGFLAVRSARRARRAPRDPSRPRRTPLWFLGGALELLALAGGLYAALFLAFRGMWAFAIPAIALWLLLLGWVGWRRSAGRAR